MKKFFRLLSIGSIILLASCDPNRGCDDVICGPNQVCDRGQCICTPGYEGADCVDLAYLKYEGFNYNINISCQQPIGGVNFLNGNIVASINPINELQFQNFLNTGQTAFAYIGTDATNQGSYIRFNNQNLGSSAFQIAGEGFYEDFGGLERIRIEIQITSPGQSNFCTLTYQ